MDLAVVLRTGVPSVILFCLVKTNSNGLPRLEVLIINSLFYNSYDLLKFLKSQLIFINFLKLIFFYKLDEKNSL